MTRPALALLTRSALFSWGALALLGACNTPTVDRPSLFRGRGGAAPIQARAILLGSWEVTYVNGVPVAKLGADELPFTTIRFGADGQLQMDTYVTEYELIEENHDQAVLAYSTIGREGTLYFHVIDGQNAELTETVVDPLSQERHELRVQLQRIP